MNSFSTLRQSCFVAVELSTKSIAPMSGRTEFVNLENGFSNPVKWEDREFLGALSLGIRRTLEKLAGGLELVEHFPLVTRFFPLCWCFAIIAETSGFWLGFFICQS